MDKLIDKVSQYGIDSEMNFHTDSKIENFSSLLDDQLVPLCDFLADGLTEKSFYHKLKFRLNLTIKQTLIIGNSIIPILTIKKKNKKKKTVVWRKIKVVMITY